SDLSCTVALSRFRGFSLLFFFTPPATTEIYPLSLHDALPILVDRLMYSLAARDPSRYPLPWGGETPSETRPEPAFMAFLSEEERSEEHTSELQSRFDLVCRLLLEKKKNNT